MKELPKPAHRSPVQKATGYFRAGAYGMTSGLRALPPGHEFTEDARHILDQIESLVKHLEESMT